MMKSPFFKYTTISLIFINIWQLYGFFDYYIHLECNSWARDWGLAFYFFYSVMFGLFIGIIMILLRIVLFFKRKRHNMKNNFVYVFTCVFNLNIFIIGLTAILLKNVYLGNNITLYLMGNFLIASIFLGDLYFNYSQMD